jgi:DNA-binding NarL/FixJ family response regulator
MHAPPTPLNVLIVDDHDIVRLGVRQVLERLPGPAAFATRHRCATRWTR